VNQTFEVLMTTTLSAEQIVGEKVRALRPLMVVLACRSSSFWYGDVD
jgi:hypothetical protein